MGKLTDLCALKNLHDRDRIGYWCDSSPIMHGVPSCIGLCSTAHHCAVLCSIVQVA